MKVKKKKKWQSDVGVFHALCTLFTLFVFYSVKYVNLIVVDFIKTSIFSRVDL